MHVEELHHAPKTWGDFLRQYAMIVLSILTAVGIEQALVSAHDRQMAEDSRRRIEDEIARNLEDLRHSIATDEAARTYIHQTLGDFAKQVKQGSWNDDKTVALAKSASGHFSMTLFTWRRDAWDAAIADQSAGKLAPSDLRRYTEIYSEARDESESTRLSLSGEVLEDISELQWDIQTGKPDTRKFGIFLNRFLVAVSNVLEAQKQVVELIEHGPASYTAGVPKNP
jgi:hypothetical protein